MGPMFLAILNSVPPELRNLAIAGNGFYIHVTGAIPCPLVIGLLNEYIGMKASMILLYAWSLIAVVTFGLVWWYSTRPDVNLPNSKKEVLMTTYR
jgi:hypothetical protein